MKQRLFSTLSLSAILISVLWILGIFGIIIIVALLAFLTQYEFYQLLERAGLKPWRRLGLACGLLITLGAGLTCLVMPSGASGILLFLSLFVLSGTLLIQPLNLQTLKGFMGTLAGLLYVPFMLQFYILLAKDFQRDEQPIHGLFIFFWLILIAKLTDVGGLLIGQYFGRTRLLPAVSPRKTREGALSGIVLAVVSGMLLVIFFRPYFPDGFSPLLAGFFAALIALASIASDLFASFIKRQAKVKDSGTLIPGIGGVLDLTDSLLLSAPLGYLLLSFYTR